MGRFYRSLEDEIWDYSSLSDYIEYYNANRLHFSLDIDNYEIPMMILHNKRATDDTKHQNPKWMEVNIDG